MHTSERGTVTGMLEGGKQSADSAIMENPYEPPRSQPSAPPKPSQQTGSRPIRLSVFLAHCLLLVLFPPGCCPCGFGPIGFLFLPYMLLLGFPAIILGFVVPDVMRTIPATFLVAYIVNYVVMSYLIAELAGRYFGRKQIPETDGGDHGCGEADTES